MKHQDEDIINVEQLQHDLKRFAKNLTVTITFTAFFITALASLLAFFAIR